MGCLNSIFQVWLDKDGMVLLTVLQRRKVIIIRNVHGLYSERELHDNRWIIDNQYSKANK